MIRLAAAASQKSAAAEPAGRTAGPETAAAFARARRKRQQAARFKAAREWAVVPAGKSPENRASQ